MKIGKPIKTTTRPDLIPVKLPAPKAAPKPAPIPAPDIFRPQPAKIPKESK